MNARIIERGNGFPDVDDYVQGNDGELYRIVTLDDCIQTGHSGLGPWLRGTVEPAEWDDVPEDWTSRCAVEVAS